MTHDTESGMLAAFCMHLARLQNLTASMYRACRERINNDDNDDDKRLGLQYT